MIRTITAWTLCAAGTAFLIRYELHTDDTGIEVAFLLALTFMLGALHPARPWVWALIVGLAVPAADLLFGPAQPITRLLPVAAFTTAVAFAGTLVGALAGRAFVRSGQLS